MPQGPKTTKKIEGKKTPQERYDAKQAREVEAPDAYPTVVTDEQAEKLTKAERKAKAADAELGNG